MPLFAAAAFQYDFVLEKFGPHGRDPSEEFLVVLLILVRKLLPRPTELICGSLLVSFDIFQIGKTGNTAKYLERAFALQALQLTRHDLNALGFTGVEL
jgi:hypothetical protein